MIDHFKIMEFPAAEISTMGNMFLAIFLSMALSGLKLWQLVDLALPMIVALAAEVLLMVVFSLLVVFPVMGHDYDAAMITAGFIGFGMGATSNAMANMQAVSRRSSRWSAASSTTSSTLRSLHSVSVFLRENRLRAQSPSKRAER